MGNIGRVLKKVDYILYLVTDRKLLNGRDTCDCIEEAVLGGVTMIQLREKEISTLELYETALKVKNIAGKYNIPFIVNDRLDIALSVDAEGLHIGQEDLPLPVARCLLGPDRIIGVSVSTVEEALLAQSQGADYLGVGAIFPTETKSDAKYPGLAGLCRIRAAVNIPVVAIGGINETNAPQVMAAGADGVAVVSAILGQPDIRGASLRLYQLITGHNESGDSSAENRYRP